MIGMENNNNVFHKNTYSLIIYLSNVKRYGAVQPTSWSDYHRFYTSLSSLWLHYLIIAALGLKSRGHQTKLQTLPVPALMYGERGLDKDKREPTQQQQGCLQVIWCNGDRHMRSDEEWEALFTVGELCRIASFTDKPSFIRAWARSQLVPSSDSAAHEIDEWVKRASFQRKLARRSRLRMSQGTDTGIGQEQMRNEKISGWK